ncbi:MAG: hypothetical protein C0475_07905 [Planctomyces sp.]|nr:hypothetical protein [Planctomyces sp.]
MHATLSTRRARHLCAAVAFAACAALGPGPAPGPRPAAAAPDFVATGDGSWRLESALAISGVRGLPDDPIPFDRARFARLSGLATTPREHEAIDLPGAPLATWGAVRAGPDGSLDALAARFGYLVARAPTLERDTPLILDASGNSMAFIDGQPRAGRARPGPPLPIPFMANSRGSELWLAPSGAGPVRAELRTPRAPVMLEARDATLPDVIAGDPSPLWASVLIVNATDAPAQPVLRVRWGAGAAASQAVERTLPQMPPLSVAKAAFQTPPRPGAQATPTPTPGALQLELAVFSAQPAGPDAAPADTASLTLRLLAPDAPHLRTYVSAADDSVQAYALIPPTLGPAALALPAPRPGEPLPAVVLSLHDGQDPLTHAGAHASRPWSWTVVPAGRRPAEAAWDETARRDALEALAHAARLIRPDPSRVYVMGLGRGALGALQLATAAPDLFAAVGLSAPWSSFESARRAGLRLGQEPPDGASPDDIALLCRRAAAQQDTAATLSNLAGMGVYILHGELDAEVPADESRRLADALLSFHRDWDLFIQPGAGHRWDLGPWAKEPGQAGVEWPPMLEFFARRARPPQSATRAVRLTSTDLSVASRRDWATLWQQQRVGLPSAVDIKVSPAARAFEGVTSNTAALRLAFAPLLGSGPLTITLDGQTLVADQRADDQRAFVSLSRADGAWRLDDADPAARSPLISGPVRRAFDRSFVLVHGTGGTAEENDWARHRARYDAERWTALYNATPRVVPDTGFRQARFGDVNAVVYGNRDTNSAWAALLASSPIRVDRSAVRLGEHAYRSDSLGVTLLRPIGAGSTGLVAGIGGTGIAGMRLTDHLPIFEPGLGLPDALVLEPAALLTGAPGALAGGFFGTDWSFDTGEWVIRQRDPAP